MKQKKQNEKVRSMYAPDVVYIVREGDDNEELRYSLRSICANLRHGTVWMVGNRPPWVADMVEFIHAPNPAGKWVNGPARIRAACKSSRTPESFLYFNDDFFVVQPIHEVPLLNRGSLRLHIEHSKADQEYRSTLIETYEFLQKCEKLRGVDLLSYEVHAPLPVQKEEMLKIIEETGSVKRPQYRSLYGNLCRIGGISVSDCKAANRTRYAPYGPFVSTTDLSFSQGLIGKQLRANFPEPCRYEA